MNIEPDAEEIRELPDVKLEELMRRVNGGIAFCEDCGTKTAFIGTGGHSSVSECHECGHKKQL